MKKIIVHPYFDAVWCSYFLKGLIDLYGLNNIEFSRKGFPANVEDRSAIAESGYLHFLVNTADGKQVKFVIDVMDRPKFDDSFLEWADVYGKVNIDPENLPAKHAEKLIASSPHFPIQFAGLGQMISVALKTFNFSLKSYIGHFKKHIYRPLKHHRPIESYLNSKSRKGYILMTSTYWKKNVDTNVSRANFMRAAKSIPTIEFEGGFFERGDIASVYPDLIYKKTGKDEYNDKLAMSSVVFTSSSVQGAHSFRIAEYLAMGKAIILPPLKRLTTTPLVHGEHVHLTEPEEDLLREAICKIDGDDEYRAKLEEGARRYFQEHGQPKMMMKKIIEFGVNRVSRKAASLSSV